MQHKGYFNKIFNTCVALPHILLETIITCKNHNVQENEKSKQKNSKLKKDSCPIHISQMYDYVFNEEEMKKRKENKKKKTRREKVLPFSQSPSENRMWILEFACYPRPSIKIKAQSTLP